jgi:hypothetical protein
MGPPPSPAVPQQEKAPSLSDSIGAGAALGSLGKKMMAPSLKTVTPDLAAKGLDLGATGAVNSFVPQALDLPDTQMADIGKDVFSNLDIPMMDEAADFGDVGGDVLSGLSDFAWKNGGRIDTRVHRGDGGWVDSGNLPDSEADVLDEKSPVDPHMINKAPISHGPPAPPKAPSGGGGGGDSTMSDLANVAKIAMMFIKNGGRVHRDTGGGISGKSGGSGSGKSSGSMGQAAPQAYSSYASAQQQTPQFGGDQGSSAWGQSTGGVGLGNAGGGMGGGDPSAMMGAYASAPQQSPQFGSQTSGQSSMSGKGGGKGGGPSSSAPTQAYSQIGNQSQSPFAGLQAASQQALGDSSQGAWGQPASGFGGVNAWGNAGGDPGALMGSYGSAPQQSPQFQSQQFQPPQGGGMSGKQGGGGMSGKQSGSPQPQAAVYQNQTGQAGVTDGTGYQGASFATAGGPGLTARAPAGPPSSKSFGQTSSYGGGYGAPQSGGYGYGGGGYRQPQYGGDQPMYGGNTYGSRRGQGYASQPQGFDFAAPQLGLGPQGFQQSGAGKAMLFNPDGTLKTNSMDDYSPPSVADAKVRTIHQPSLTGGSGDPTVDNGTYGNPTGKTPEERAAAGAAATQGITSSRYDVNKIASARPDLVAQWRKVEAGQDASAFGNPTSFDDFVTNWYNLYGKNDSPSYLSDWGARAAGGRIGRAGGGGLGRQAFADPGDVELPEYFRNMDKPNSSRIIDLFTGALAPDRPAVPYKKDDPSTWAPSERPFQSTGHLPPELAAQDYPDPDFKLPAPSPIAPTSGLSTQAPPAAPEAAPAPQAPGLGAAKPPTGLGQPFAPHQPAYHSDTTALDSLRKTLAERAQREKDDPNYWQKEAQANAEWLAGPEKDRPKFTPTEHITAEKDGLNSPWMALVHAGLGMASGRSPSFLANLAGGAQEGVKALSQQAKEKADLEDKNRQIDDKNLEKSIKQSEIQTQLRKFGKSMFDVKDSGNLKTAKELADVEAAQNQTKQHDITFGQNQTKFADEQQDHAHTVANRAYEGEDPQPRLMPDKKTVGYYNMRTGTWRRALDITPEMLPTWDDPHGKDDDKKEKTKIINVPDPATGGVVQKAVREYKDGSIREVQILPAETPGAFPVPTPDKIAKLKSDPSLAPFFDQKYGPGAAKRALGQ